MSEIPSSSQPHVLAAVDALPEVTATMLKNKFAEVVRRASRGPVAITRHNRREFVILTAEKFEELQQSRGASLEGLTAEFDQLVARMNTPADKAARRKFFNESAVKSDPALAGLKKDREHAR